jgi:PmbA protein
VSAYVQFSEQRKECIDYFTFINKVESIDIDEIKKELVKNISKLEQSNVFESNEYEIIIDRGLLMNLLLNFSNHFTNRKAIDKTSIFLNKKGTKIFSDQVSLVDCNYFKELGIHVTYDDEAIPAKTKYVVENGVLKMFLSDQKTASILNEESSGNSFNSSTSFIYPYIENGKYEVEEMIKTTKKGVLITEFKGYHSGLNNNSADFSLEISGNIVIDGKVKDSIKEAILIGNVFSDIFNNIKYLGNDIDFLRDIYSPSAKLDRPVKISFSAEK